MPGVDHYEDVTSRDMSLEDFIRERGSIRATNDQTRLISGVERVNARLLSGGALPNEEAGSIDILEVAKRNLEEHFTMVGLTERFDESLLLWRKLFGWKNIYYVRRNVAKGRPTKQQVARAAVNLKIEWRESRYSTQRHREKEETSEPDKSFGVFSVSAVSLCGESQCACRLFDE